MRLSIPEKILWAIYNGIETLDRLYEPFAIRSVRDAVNYRIFKVKREIGRKIDRRRFANLISYLKRKGWIKVKELEGRKGIILTPKGVEKVMKVKCKMAIKKKRKDGKWVMTIFDIPEKLRKIRENFRNNLKMLGYQYLQKSIWICSYDVLKETQELILNYKIEKFVRLLLIEEILI